MRKMRISIISITLIAWVYFPACKKNKPRASELELHISYVLDSFPLIINTPDYLHPAGYKYGIYKLQYFISSIRLIKTDNSIWTDNNVHYIDALVAGTNNIILKDIPAGNYKEIQFLVGLDSIQNKTGFLPAETWNLNMAWPDAMGGGYHFLKLEGIYNDSAGNHGFAMHLGRTGNEVKIKLPVKNITIISGDNIALLTMNIQEWFRNPALYDFNKDGNYSMSNAAAMLKLKTNGEDVFHE